MTDPQSGSQESSAQSATQTGGSPTQTGSATDAATSAGMTPEVFKQMIQEAQAPLLQEIQHLKNESHARKRQATKTQDPSGGEGEGAQKPKTTEEQLRQEVNALKKANADRAEQERKARGKAAVDKLISPENFAHAGIMRDLVEPHLHEGETGELFYDAGDKLIPLADKVKELGTQAVFQLPASGAGTGTKTEPTVARVEGKQVTAADMTKMTPEEFKKVKAAKMAGKTNF